MQHTDPPHARLAQVEEEIKTRVWWSEPHQSFFEGCFDSQDAFFSGTPIRVQSALLGRTLRLDSNAAALTPVEGSTRVQLHGWQAAAFVSDVKSAPRRDASLVRAGVGTGTDVGAGASAGTSPATVFAFDRADIITSSNQHITSLSLAPASALLVDRATKKFRIEGGSFDNRAIFTFEAKFSDAGPVASHAYQVSSEQDTACEVFSLNLQGVGMERSEDGEQIASSKATYFIDDKPFWDEVVDAFR